MASICYICFEAASVAENMSSPCKLANAAPAKCAQADMSNAEDKVPFIPQVCQDHGVPGCKAFDSTADQPNSKDFACTECPRLLLNDRAILLQSAATLKPVAEGSAPFVTKKAGAPATLVHLRPHAEAAKQKSAAALNNPAASSGISSTVSAVSEEPSRGSSGTENTEASSALTLALHIVVLRLQFSAVNMDLTISKGFAPFISKFNQLAPSQASASLGVLSYTALHCRQKLTCTGYSHNNLGAACTRLMQLSNLLLFGLLWGIAISLTPSTAAHCVIATVCKILLAIASSEILRSATAATWPYLCSIYHTALISTQQLSSKCAAFITTCWTTLSSHSKAA